MRLRYREAYFREGADEITFTNFGENYPIHYGKYYLIPNSSYYMDDESVTEYTFTAAKMTLDKFNEVFDGNAPVFTLSGTINGGEYSKDLGLKLTAPTVTSISASTGAYTF